MLRNWTERFSGWLQGGQLRKPRRQRQARRDDNCRLGAMVQHLEPLESRRLLTNVVAVHVDGNDILLRDVTHGRANQGDDFTVSYTSTQVVLTGQNGTLLKVNDQTVSTFTVNITAPP